MGKRNDSRGDDYGGFAPAIPAANLTDNHATKNGGPELPAEAPSVRNYGGEDNATPYCEYSGNHSTVGAGKISTSDY